MPKSRAEVKLDTDYFNKIIEIQMKTTENVIRAGDNLELAGACIEAQTERLIKIHKEYTLKIHDIRHKEG